MKKVNVNITVVNQPQVDQDPILIRTSRALQIT